MKAIRVQQYGGPEVLRLEESEAPAPGPGQALVRLRAAGVNFIDIYQRRGGYPVPLPYTPGLEGAGTVEAVGQGVTDVHPGDRVAYTGSPGSYAEANVVPADRLLPLPANLSFEQGAAFPLQGMTAHYLIHEYRLPRAGDTVLIHAAAGGMGLLLVQWAHHLGARVLGTVSTEEKARVARESGVDEVILYSRQDFAEEVLRLTGGHGADLIIDGVGKATFAGNLKAAALRGQVVIFGAASGPADPISPNALMARSLSLSGGNLGNYTRTREELLRRARDVLEGLHAGWLRLRLDHVWPLAEAAEAHRRLEGRQTVGKIVLTCA
ncbi:MAG: quinone oxidoreductase [Planctomycetes bacterium]|nr:quinone oxidoreductase [Planctomycetota bacterium]